MSNQSGGDAKTKKKTALLVPFLMLVIAALGVVILIQHNKNNAVIDTSVTSNAQPAEKRNVVVNKDNVDEILKNLAEEDKTPPGNYEVTMSTTWDFPDGSSPSGNAYVENAVVNTNDVYFDVTLEDTGETIYKSPVIPVGSYLKNIELDKPLAKGSYSSIITYSLLDEEQNVLSTVSVGFVINVEK